MNLSKFSEEEIYLPLPINQLWQCNWKGYAICFASDNINLSGTSPHIDYVSW